MTTDRQSRSSIDAACVHGGDLPLGMATPALSPPIVRSSVFLPGDLATVERASASEPGMWIYGRHGNPTVDAFERAMADLEGAERALAAASGMGAISATLKTFVRPGERIVTTGALYGFTRQLLDGYLLPDGIAVEHRDAASALAGLPPDTRIVFTESIANPLLEVADLPALAEAAHAAGALLIVDATFVTPAICRPLELGADVIVHSATKYLNGHGDLILGVVAASAELVARIHTTLTTFGATPDPTAAWLALRGLRTLHLRMERHGANAMQAAAWLADRPEVENLWYPGIKAHPTHAVAVRDLGTNFGGMVSFELSGGRPAVERFLTGLRMIRLAPSLGDVATTISYPATTSHRGISAAEREAQGITDGVLRLSCGIETAADITTDLLHGFRAL